MDDKKQGEIVVCGQPQTPLTDFDPPKLKTRKRNKYAIACSFLASLSSILLGYDIGVMSGAIIYIKKDLNINDVEVEVLVGILNLYSLIGSAAAGWTSDWIGRRNTMVVAAVIFFAGALLMGFATNYVFLMFGRFIAGIGVGYALVIVPVYTVEVSPESSRGLLTSFPEVFINIGILLGYVSNVAFSKLPTHLSWRFMLGIESILALFLDISVLAMPESPRWLVMKGRLHDARIVLKKTSESSEQSEIRLCDIKEAAGIPQHWNDDVVQVPKCPKGDNAWKDLFFSPTPSIKHIVVTGIGIHFFQQASGIDSLVLYSPTIFEKAGIKSDADRLIATVVMGCVKTIFILIATLLLDRVGRRPLVLTSFGGMAISLTFLSIGLTVIDHSNDKVMWAIALCVTMVLAYVSLFSIGAGPIAWVYGSEIFPLRLRATGFSVGVAVNRVSSALVSMTFLSLTKAISIEGAFFLYAGIAGMAWAFFFTLMPETQGKTLEETEVLFGTFYKWRSTLRELKAKKMSEKNDNVQIQMASTAVSS